MSEQSTVQQSLGTFTEADFDAVANLYGGHASGAKFKRLMDVAAALGVDDLESYIVDLNELIGTLRDMAERGQGHTPPAGKNFGSDNAAVIADKILGNAQTVGDTRKAFADWGKNAR